MIAYRITRRKWADSISGSGYAARWNEAGSRMLYTSSSIALALLEILVHIKIDQIPSDYVWLKATIPDIAITYVSDMPSDPASFGTNWLKTGHEAVLSVPSVIVPERNFLLNPDNTDFSRIEWSEPTDLIIDPRLLRSA